MNLPPNRGRFAAGSWNMTQMQTVAMAGTARGSRLMQIPSRVNSGSKMKRKRKRARFSTVNRRLRLPCLESVR